VEGKGVCELIGTNSLQQLLMAFRGRLQRPFVVTGGQRLRDRTGDHAHLTLEHAHVVYEHGVDEAQFGVGDVHGDGVHGVLARVHRYVDGGHG